MRPDIWIRPQALVLQITIRWDIGNRLEASRERRSHQGGGAAARVSSALFEYSAASAAFPHWS
jgi:hypothetical protein